MDEDVHGAHETGDAIWWDEPGGDDASIEPELADAGEESFAPPAVADPEEPPRGIVAEVAGDGVEDVVVSFVLGEACDGADDEFLCGEPERGADLLAGVTGGGVQEGVGFHAAVYGAVERGCADASGEELAGHGVGDGEDGVASAGGVAFGDGVDEVFGADECASERRALDGHERRAVDGVDDAGDAGIEADTPCGVASEDARLAGVGVDDVGTQGADERGELASAAGIADGAEFADEVGDDVDADGRCGIAGGSDGGEASDGADAFGAFGAGAVEGFDSVEQGTFGSVDGAEGEVDGVAEAGLSLAGEDGVLL